MAWSELSVIVDNRERNAELLSELEALGVAITVETLPVGDYVDVGQGLHREEDGR